MCCVINCSHKRGPFTALMSICADGRVSSVFSVRMHLTPETESQKPYCSSWLYAVHHHSASGTFKSFSSPSFFYSWGEVGLTRLELCFNFNTALPIKTSQIKVPISYTAVALLQTIIIYFYLFLIFKENRLSAVMSCYIWLVAVDRHRDYSS